MQNSLQQQEGFKVNPRWVWAGLLIVVGITLFPYGLIPFRRIFSFSPELFHVIQHVFASDLAHIMGHAAIFFVIGTAVLLVFPALLNRPKLYFGLIMTLGILQEFFQIVGFKHRAIVFDDVFDVVVDLTGALIAFLLLQVIWKRAASSPTEKSNEVVS